MTKRIPPAVDPIAQAAAQGWPGPYSSTPPQVPDGDTVPVAPAPKKRHRVFWWTFVAIQLLFLAWVIAGATTVPGTGGSCQGLDHSTCVSAHETGGTIGVALLVILWAVTDIIVGGSYAIYRLTRKSR